MSRFESDVSCFWSLQTLFDDDCVGCAPAAPVDVGLAPFVVDVAEVGVPLDGDDPGAPNDVWPVMSAGEARLDTGGPGKT